MELQDHLKAIDRITAQIENNRQYLFGNCDEKRKIAAELNGHLSKRADDHWTAVRMELDVVGLGVAA